MLGFIIISYLFLFTKHWHCIKLLLSLDSYCGPYEKMLLKHLLYDYERQNRPVLNETEPLVLTFGITLQQIIDVVSADCLKQLNWIEKYSISGWKKSNSNNLFVVKLGKQTFWWLFSIVQLCNENKNVTDPLLITTEQQNNKKQK